MRTLHIVLLLFYPIVNLLSQPTARERSVMVSVSAQTDPAQLQFRWPSVAGDSPYTIYKKSVSALDWGMPIATLSAEATSFIDSDIALGQLYEYAFFREAYSLVKDTLCISPGTPVQFAIRDFNNKGVCCNFGYGFYKVEACGKIIVEGGDFRGEEITEFTLCESNEACEEMIITVSPDMFPNSTYWQVNDQRDGSDLGNSGAIGQFLTPRPAYGFITAGIEVSPLNDRGSILLVIDDEYTEPLLNEIETLKLDLVKDGWKVQTLTANKGDAVTFVKSKIKTVYDQTADLKAVFILGHVPVPYSGDMYPDTHSENHWGAWSADSYYGEMTSDWTDTIANNQLAFFERNKNVPGDGKFDQSQIPSAMELQVGRVDFFNMLAFAKSEIELTRSYLNKLHRWKIGDIEVRRRGLVDDNFRQQFAAPAASAWRNFAPMFGADDIDELDYFSSMRNNSYLWSYGCGSGTHMSSEGIGSTFDFANDSLLTVFTMLFGSQFGDWDNDNNFLKAPLASGLTLTNVWAGNPPWQFHHMAMGQPIGYSTIRTQNSMNGGYRSGPQLVHTALMGDPSLRMHMIAPPTEFVFAINDVSASINWTASTDPEVIGYNVYRSDQQNGDYTQLNSELITALQFIDNHPMNGLNHYQIKAVKLETTGSGSYYNQSLGLMGMVDFLVNTQSPTISEGLTIYPNPTSSVLSIELNTRLEGPFSMEIYNSIGQRIWTGKLPHSQVKNGVFQLDTRNWNTGMYLLEIKHKQVKYFTKVIKQGE